ALIASRRLSRSKKPGCLTAFPCAADVGTRESLICAGRASAIFRGALYLLLCRYCRSKVVAPCFEGSPTEMMTRLKQFQEPWLLPPRNLPSKTFRSGHRSRPAVEYAAPSRRCHTRQPSTGVLAYAAVSRVFSSTARACAYRSN